MRSWSVLASSHTTFMLAHSRCVSRSSPFVARVKNFSCKLVSNVANDASVTYRVGHLTVKIRTPPGESNGRTGPTNAIASSESTLASQAMIPGRPHTSSYSQLLKKSWNDCTCPAHHMDQRRSVRKARLHTSWCRLSHQAAQLPLVSHLRCSSLR